MLSSLEENIERQSPIMLGPNITGNATWPVGADGQASWSPLQVMVP